MLAFVGLLIIIIAVVIRRRGLRAKEEMLPASSSKDTENNDYSYNNCLRRLLFLFVYRVISTNQCHALNSQNRPPTVFLLTHGSLMPNSNPNYGLIRLIL